MSAAAEILVAVLYALFGALAATALWSRMYALRARAGSAQVRVARWRGYADGLRAAGTIARNTSSKVPVTSEGAAVMLAFAEIAERFAADAEREAVDGATRESLRDLAMLHCVDLDTITPKLPTAEQETPK